MGIICVTEHNTECYGVSFESNGWIMVQNFDDISHDKNTIYCVKPLEIFLGKSESFMLRAFSGASNKPVFHGNPILLKLSEEKYKNKYFHIGGDMVCSFLTNDKMYKYISNVGNNLILYSIAIGEEKVYFLTRDSEFFKRGNFKNIKSKARNENFVDLFDNHYSNCRKDSFEK